MPTLRKFVVTLFLTLCASSFGSSPAPQAPSFYNGFDVSDSLIPLNAIDHGGPGRDGIPALDAPVFISGTERDNQVALADRVLGVSFNGVAKAYPVRILDHHEIVNDSFAGTPLTVTFCPLCGTGMVFHAEQGGRRMEFGVSGLLYNSDLLLYDRETGSLWSQIMRTAVTGPMKGARLVQVPAQYTTWASWLAQFPESLLLSRDTGHQRDYSGELYRNYRRLPGTRFSTGYQDPRLPGKEWVVGIELADAALALPFSALDQLRGPLATTLGGQPLTVAWDRDGAVARAFTGDGTEVPVTAAYWFAWVAFHPETELYSVGDQRGIK